LCERDQLTFEAIAKRLAKSGTRAVKDRLLGAEHVFHLQERPTQDGAPVIEG
jgi:hypothetical protein